MSEETKSGSDHKLAAARQFTRNLEATLKSSRLYGLQNERSRALLNAAWHDLNAALAAGGEGGLLLGVARGHLLVDGTPLATSPAERGIVDLLTAGGLASVQFSRRTRQEDFVRLVEELVRPLAQPGALAVSLRNTLGHPSASTIRVNAVPLTPQAQAAPPAASSIPARATSATPSEWLRDPRSVLELLSAASAAKSAESAEDSARRVTGLGDWKPFLSLLRSVAEHSASSAAPDPQVFRTLLAETPAATLVHLRHALDEMSRASAVSSQPHLFVQLARRFALQIVEDASRGTSASAPVDSTTVAIDTMAAEFLSFSQALSPSSAPLAADRRTEPLSETLHRQFWAALPEPELRRLLLSASAWSVPTRVLASWVQQALESSDLESAGAALFSFASCVHSADREARRRTAAGLTELAREYAARGSRFLDFAVYHVGEQLSAEKDAELQSLLAAALLRLSQEAAGRRDFPALQQVLAKLSSVQQDQPALAERLRPRLAVESHLHQFIDEYLKDPAPNRELVGVLHRVPAAAAVELAQRFNRCARREECERLVALARETGNGCVEHLRQTFAAGSEPAAASTVGLLSRLDIAFLQRGLPERLRQWRQSLHDLLVRQLALGSARERGRILVDEFELLDPFVLPEAIDEIGLCADPATAPHLLSLAGGERPEFASPFVRIKAIEALGRMREARAVPLLRDLAESRSRWMWTHPRELRLVAAQALTRIDPAWGMSFLPGSGLSTAELRNGPLDPAGASDWARARRYPRIALDKTLSAVARTARSHSNLSLRALTLGGGLAASDGRLAAGSEAAIEIRAGLRPIRAQVLLREAPREELCFEIARMEFDERHRLRKLIGELPQ